MLYSYSQYAVDTNGTIVPSADVVVRNFGTGAVASNLTDATGAAKSGTFTAGDDGLVEFWGPAGVYRVTIGVDPTDDTEPVTLGPAGDFETVAALLADTSMRYAASGEYQHPVAANGYVTAGGFRYKIASGTATDRHLITAGEVRLYVMPARDGSFSPAAFGISGGASVVSDEFKAMLTDVGVGAVIRGEPGATYVIDARLTLLDGQKFIGNGAKLKRADTLTATTTSSIATGVSPQTITVSDASGLRVGADITVTSGGTTDPSAHSIASISGNNVTLESQFTQAFSAGASIVSAFTLIHAVADDVLIDGWEIDGNRTNWGSAGRRWETDNEIYAAGDRLHITNNYIHDTPVEGIQFGGTGAVVSGNTIVDCGGNAMHLSAAHGCKVSGNYIENTQLWEAGGEDPGHQDGCISFSNDVQDCIISNNNMINGESGFGSIDQSDNGRNTFSGNLVVSCGSPWDMQSYDDGIGDIQIIGNRFEDCGQGVIGLTNTGAATSEYSHNVQISNNMFLDTWVQIAQAREIDISGNRFDLSADNSAQNIIYVGRGSDVRICANAMSGGGYGVYVDSAAGDRVVIRGNDLSNQVNSAVRCQSFSGDVLRVSENQTSTGAASVAAYVSILENTGKSMVQNNDILADVGDHGIEFHQPNALATGNRIQTGAGVDTIRINGGVSGCVAVANFIDTAVNDVGSGNTTTGNFLI